MSESNRIRLAYVAEPANGYAQDVTDPGFKRVRYTSENLNITPETVQSEEIRDDRMVADTVAVGLTTGGDIAFELSFEAFDDFIAAALHSAWADPTPPVANVKELTTGTTDKSIQILKSYMDLDKHILFRGMRMNTFGLNYTFKQVLTGTMNFVGANYTLFESQTELDAYLGSGDITDGAAHQPLNASADIKRVLLDGSPSDVCFRSIQVNVNNGMRAQECIGSATPKNQFKGDSQVGGNIELYFTNNSWPILKDSLDQSPMGLGFEAGDSAGRKLLIEAPRAKVTVPTPSAGGRNQDAMLNGTWNATYDAGEDTDIRITRTLVP